jgi:hypothetical protein
MQQQWCLQHETEFDANRLLQGEPDYLRAEQYLADDADSVHRCGGCCRSGIDPNAIYATEAASAASVLLWRYVCLEDLEQHYPRQIIALRILLRLLCPYAR